MRHFSPDNPKRLARCLPLLSVLLLAALLRFHGLAQDKRFHGDEAYFAAFARSAALNGAWMLPGALDKTPLTLYAMAFSMHFAARGSSDTLLDFDARQGEFAARVPNTFASLLLVAVIYALTQRLYRDRRAALLAALLAALSPALLAFSATAFTDMGMLLCMTLALYLAAARRPLAAGLWLGLAFASKQQALFYLPLIALWLYPSGWRALLRFAQPLALVWALLLLWDAARGETTGIFALAAEHNSPAGLMPLTEIGARLALWLHYAAALLGPPALTLAFTLWVFWSWRKRFSRTTVLFGLFIMAYSALHILFGFNLYDRYLLVIAPLCIVLTAHALAPTARGMSGRSRLSLSGVWRRFTIGGRILLLVLLVLAGTALLAEAWTASAGLIEFGGARTDSGILALADFLNAQTLGAIVYDRWLGWELNYYLGQWTDKRKVYYPTPALLLEGALAQPEPAPRYFVAPLNYPYQTYLDVLAQAGFAITLVYAAAPFRVYRLIPPWANSGV
ncbi:MAG: glycosyltransferase family 39 protein [Chloroflexi bacterium]|nr:glycosyltransferase family 39 protein [Chloroflexota bacterium]